MNFISAFKPNKKKILITIILILIWIFLMYKFQGNPMCEPCPLTVNKNCPDFSYLVPLKICYCCFTLGDVAVNWFIFVLPGIIYYVFMLTKHNIICIFE